MPDDGQKMPDQIRRQLTKYIMIYDMKGKFLDFWYLYAPERQYHNRYVACKRLWEQMEDSKCEQMLNELRKEKGVKHEKNPYFYLIDWEPKQPHWLTPREVGYLLAQHVALAVCRRVGADGYGTVTKEEAELLGLEVHHWM